MQTLKPGGGLQTVFIVRDLQADQAFEFDDQEYFICHAWDGEKTVSQVLVAFQEQFQQRLKEEDLTQFIHGLGELGLLEPCTHLSDLPASSPAKVEQRHVYLVSLKSPDALFKGLLGLSRQLRWLWIGLAVLAIPGVPIAVLTLFRHWRLFYYDLANVLSDHPSLLLAIHFIFMGVNLAATVTQGIVLTSYGGSVRELGFALALGFLPHVAIEMDDFTGLNRQKQLWVFGSPLLMLLVLMMISVPLWFSVQGFDTSLHTISILLTLASCLCVLLDGSPLWLSNGYAWMLIYFRLPHLINKSRLFWSMLLFRRPFPPYIRQRERLFLFLFGMVTVIISALVVFQLILLFSSNIGALLAGILGDSSNEIVLTLVVVLFAWFIWKHWK